MMYHKGAIVSVLWTCVCVCVFSAGAQAPESETPETAAPVEEYNEYESIPPPRVELRSDVVPDVAGDVPPEPASAEAGESAEPLPVAGADPLLDEVNRELDARRGTSRDAHVEGAEDSTADSKPYSLMKAFAWLLFVLAMILLLYYVLQRRSSGGKLLTGNRLGSVLGRIYLSPRVCLHFVRTGGKVLVVGQSQNALRLIAEFAEAEFAAAREETEAPAESGGEEGQSNASPDFFSQLRANLAQINRPGEEDAPEPNLPVDEDDIAALRGDIHRLQEYLRDSTRESER